MENIIERAENLGKRKMLIDVMNDMTTLKNSVLYYKYLKKHEELEKEYELLEKEHTSEEIIICDC